MDTQVKPKMDKSDTRNFTFGDAARAFRFRVPAGMSYVTLLNPNPKIVELYYGDATVDTANPLDSITTPIPFYNQTLPLPNAGDTFTLVGRDGGGDDQRVVVIFSTNNLNINASTTQPGGSQTVTIGADAAGLAKATQFPSSLNGNALRVSVENSPSVSLDSPVTIGNTVSNPIPVQGTFTAAPDVSVNFDTFDYNVTTAGTQLPGNPCKELVLVADESGTAPILIGKTASSCTFPLQPGQTLGLPLDNTNRIFVRSISATVVHVLWRV